MISDVIIDEFQGSRSDIKLTSMDFLSILATQQQRLENQY